MPIFSSRQPLTGGVTADAPRGVRNWPPRQKQVTVRFALLGCMYLVFALVAGFMFWRHGYTRTDVSSVTGGTISHTFFMLANQSIYQTNPRPVAVILIMLAAAILVSTVSLISRVARNSPKISVPGAVVASAIGVVGVLAMLSIGPFILPLAALLLVVALPMDKLSS